MRSDIGIANSMPFSPHSILQVNVRLFAPGVTKFSEKIGGSEYDNLNSKSGSSFLGVIVLRFFAAFRI